MNTPQEAGVSSQGLASEREKFERWAKENDFSLIRGDGQNYYGTHTAEAWNAWQACAALSSATGTVGGGEGEIERLRAGLKWYADGNHLVLDEDWDTVSGEPQNWLCGPEDGMVENGGTAKAVLAGAYMVEGEDEIIAEMPLAPESYKEKLAQVEELIRRDPDKDSLGGRMLEQLSAEIERHEKRAYPDFYVSGHVARDAERLWQWQPMETAPQDGTHILALWPRVRLDDDGDQTEEVTGHVMAVTFRNGNCWIEPDYLDAMGYSFDDDEEYASDPCGWISLKPAEQTIAAINTPPLPGSGK